MASKSRRSSKRRKSSGSRTTISRTKTTIVDRGPIIGAIALAAAAAVGTAVYFTHKSSSATPSGPPPGVLPAPGGGGGGGVTPAPPSSLPSSGDVFSALSPAQKLAVQTSLYAYITQSPSPCTATFPNGASDVTANGIGSSADLAVANNRALAVSCFQQGYNVANSTTLGSQGAGVLDLQTYSALTGGGAGA